MKKDITLMKLTIALLFVSSFSLLFSIFANYEGSAFQVALGYVGSALFWLCLVLGYVLFGIVSKHRKDSGATLKASHFSKKSNKPGIICFCSNRFAAIADLLMIISFILSLIFIFIPSLNQNVAVVFVAILVFSIHMHGILNGVNFTYITSLTKGEERT